MLYGLNKEDCTKVAVSRELPGRKKRIYEIYRIYAIITLQKFESNKYNSHS